MNWYAIQAIYHFEMARTFRTVWQSIVSPVISTSLYFVVFGAAIGSRSDVDQNWLPNAVKRSGAVSPAMRATATSGRSSASRHRRVPRHPRS